MLTALIVLAVLIVLALAGYAGWLHWKLYRHRRALAAQQAEYERQKTAHEDYLIDSIQIIARNMVDEDLNISEGAIRLKHLLDGLGLEDQERARFSALDELYDKVRDFDTHDARKALPVKERLQQDRAREAHERVHRTRVLETARVLIDYRFSGSGSV